MRLVLLLASTGLASAAKVYFEEKFDTEDWEKRWVTSSWKGGNGPAGKFEWTSGEWFADEKENKGIMTTGDMHYHSVSANLPEAFSSKGNTLVVQFSVKHEKKEYSFCGGGYIKLLGSKIDQANFGGDTEYKIMFGPDLCGYDIARIHTIFTYEGKNLLRNEDIKLDYDDKNEFTHLYTLVVKPDNTYEVYFDLKQKSTGSLHDHWDFPNRTKDDPDDKKPSDWVEEQKMDDPNAKQPADWKTDEKIRDPEATKPDEWDEEEDGEWEKPLIENPKYKGAWYAEKIDNPAYKGEWQPKQLPNPNFVENVHGFDDIGSVGFELWTVNKGSIFDNILITDSFEHAKEVGEKVWKPTADKEKDAKEEWKKRTGKTDGDADKKDSKEDDDDDADAKVDLDKKEDAEL